MIIQDIFLGITQGLTEFLPISSSAHLAVLPHFFNWPDQGLAFDAALHLGTLLAVVVYFRQRIWQIILERDFKFIKLIFLGTITTVLVVFVLKPFIFRDPKLIAVNLIFWAVVLYVSEKYAERNQKAKINPDLLKQDIKLKKNWQRLVFIGLAQGLAVLPGTSRSGITISAGLFAGFNKEKAIEFSFLLGIPIIFLAGLDSFYNLTKASNLVFSRQDLLLAIITSFIFGLLAIYVLLWSVKKFGFKYFIWYRFILAFLILWYL